MQVQLVNQTSSVIHDDLLEKDKWLASDIGLAPDVTHSIYSLNFTKITIPWLKLAAKKFVRFQATMVLSGNLVRTNSGIPLGLK